MLIDRRLQTRLARMALAALAMALVLIFAQHYLFDPVETRALIRWAALAALVGCGLLAYAVAGQLLRAFDLRELISMMRRRAR